MNPIVRNTLAVASGIIVGSMVNMALIKISGSIIPPPLGVDTSTMEGLKAALPLFEPKHFLFPFLAHALGTLFGALLTATIAVTHKIKFAYVVGFFFMAGGIAIVVMLHGPMWFNIIDLVFAYLPMSFLASRIAVRRNSANA